MQWHPAVIAGHFGAMQRNLLLPEDSNGILPVMSVTRVMQTKGGLPES